MHALLIAILYHQLLGIALFVAVWGVGFGLLRRLWGRAEQPNTLALYGYPLGFLWLSAAALLGLSRVAGLDWAGLGLFLAGIAACAADAALLWRAAGRCWPLVAAALTTAPFALFQGLLRHGPTPELSGGSFGDTVFYVMKLNAHIAAPFPEPVRSLLVEGVGHNYSSSGPSLLGAALSTLPAFDPFLYYAVTGPVFALLGIVAGMTLCSPSSPERAPGARREALVLGLLVATAAYPSWLIESPAVPYAIPLAFAVARLGHDERRPGGLWWTAAVLVMAATFLAKVFAFLPFAAALSWSLLRRGLERRTLLRAGALGLLGLAYVLYQWRSFAWVVSAQFELQLLPLRLLRDLGDAENLPLLVLIAGQTLLLAAWRDRARSPAFVAVAAGIGTYWLWQIYGGVAWCIAIAVLVADWRQRGTPQRRPGLLEVAVLLLLTAHWLRESEQIGALLAAASVGLFALALVPALQLSSSEPGSPSLRAARRAGVVLAVIAYLGLSGIWLAKPRQGHGPLTPADRDIWEAVRQRVPRRGLVFTDQTGRELTLKQGWNSYAGIGQRQVYLAGWYNAPQRFDATALEERLALNAAVLAGSRSPASLPLTRSYTGFFAVVDRNRQVPGGWRLLHENDALRLYEVLEPSGGG